MDDIKILVVLVALLFLVVFAPGRPTVDEIHTAHPEWSIKNCQRIADQIIWLGMTSEQARLSWGRPTRINRTVGPWGVHEQWVYGTDYLYFEDGILTSWQT